MTRFGSSNKVIISNIEVLPSWLPRIFNQAITPLLWRYAVGLSRIHNFLAMLICTGEEPYRLATLSVPSGQHIAGYSRIGMSNMRSIINVVDRRRKVKRLGIGAHWTILSALPTLFSAAFLPTIASKTTRFGRSN